MTHHSSEITSSKTPSHPKQSRSRSLQAARLKDLHLLLPLFLLLLFPANSPAQKSSTRFNGQTAYALTAELLKVAPKRFNGSPGHLKAEEFIKQHFAPEAAKGNLETDTFTASTPAGFQTMSNYIVKFPGKKDGIIVLASHYETNYPLRDIEFYGANDGAATSALLIEIGNVLRAHPPEGYSIWLAKYKYNEENKKIYMTCNLLGGFFQRLESARKYTFGSFGIFGEDDNNEIHGIFVFRGQDVPFEVTDCPDYESYEFTKVTDVNDETARKNINAFLAWGEIDGLAKFSTVTKPFKEGKNYK